MTNLGKMENIGQSKMAAVQSDLKQIIIEAIDKDKDINHKVWNENFSKRKFSEFIMININMSLKMKSQNIDFLIEIIKKTIY